MGTFGAWMSGGNMASPAAKLIGAQPRPGFGWGNMDPSALAGVQKGLAAQVGGAQTGAPQNIGMTGGNMFSAPPMQAAPPPLPPRARFQRGRRGRPLNRPVDRTMPGTVPPPAIGMDRNMMETGGLGANLKAQVAPPQTLNLGTAMRRGGFVGGRY